MENSSTQKKPTAISQLAASLNLLTEALPAILDAVSRIGSSESTTSPGKSGKKRKLDYGAMSSSLRILALLLLLAGLLAALTGQIGVEQRCIDTARLAESTQSILSTERVCNYVLAAPTQTLKGN